MRAKLSYLYDRGKNRGTAFTEEERDRLHLRGFLPYHVSTIEEQLARRKENFLNEKNPLARYLMLASLQERNETLFYRFLLENAQETLPYVYTPTIGEVSVQYSALYRQPRGLYLAYPDRNHLKDIVASLPNERIAVAVLTDGERVLGLGDVGIGGMAISQGKLTLYSLFGGIHPDQTLPIYLDVGTNNERLLQDSAYLGWRNKRIERTEYDAFIGLVVEALTQRYPHMLFQWEDFAKPNAHRILNHYRHKILSFNDDIQGTAAVVLAALYGALRRTGKSLSKQKVVIVGAGSAGIGIAKLLARDIAHEQIYVLDAHGLLTRDISRLDDEQRPFAKDPSGPAPLALDAVVQKVRPNILIGVSGKGGLFTESVVRNLADDPIIFPLSNPTECSEGRPEDLMRWAQGYAQIATGSPFPDTAQCNNVYIFPGLGLGAIASQAKEISDGMFVRAAEVVAAHAEGAILPPITQLRTISHAVAQAVAEQACAEGLSEIPTSEITDRIQREIWYPKY